MIDETAAPCGGSPPVIDATKLGGFKILKEVTRISLVSPMGMDRFPLALCRILTENKINLPYLTIVYHRKAWGINLLVEASHRDLMKELIREHFGDIPSSLVQSAIISVFPHKKNPEVSGRLLQAFKHKGVQPDGLAASPSAISVIVEEARLQEASSALFEPFAFGAYRTPEDWKLAQKGKERVFREIVASYQEKRPAVYGLNYGTGRELVQVKMKKEKIVDVGSMFRSLECSGLRLTFLASAPSRDSGSESLSFCLPYSEGATCKLAIREFSTGFRVDTISPVMTFSMSGPHFGDRFGIVCELLKAMDEQGLSILALSCTVASITGVAPQEQTDAIIDAIRSRFDVPVVKEND